MMINDPGVSELDKPFEIFVKPLLIYFPVLLAYNSLRFDFVFIWLQMKSRPKRAENCSQKIGNAVS